MPKTIYDLVTAKELAAYYIEANTNAVPYLGLTLFPRKKQLGLDLSWIKGANGNPVALKAAAFDTKAAIRDRVGISKIETEMPFFKESMLIKEKDRQELNKIMQSGTPEMVNIIVQKIFDDNLTLVSGALATEERLRMQLLSTGLIAIQSEGQDYNYSFGFNEDHKATVKVSWSDVVNATPATDIMEWQEKIEEDTGTKPDRAICTSKTWNYLKGCHQIRLDMNVDKGQNIIVTDTMLSQWFENKLGLKIAVYNKRFVDETGTAKKFFPDDVFTLIPSGIIGNTYMGTTPEESDLLSGATDAQVSIVNTGMAITTSKTVDPVNVSTKVSMITLPSFEHIEEVFIADVIA